MEFGVFDYSLEQEVKVHTHTLYPSPATTHVINQ